MQESQEPWLMRQGGHIANSYWLNAWWVVATLSCVCCLGCQSAPASQPFVFSRRCLQVAPVSHLLLPCLSIGLQGTYDNCLTGSRLFASQEWNVVELVTGLERYVQLVGIDPLHAPRRSCSVCLS